MTNVYRLAAGHVSVATLQGSSSYIVANFTKGINENWEVGNSGLIEPYLSMRPKLNNRLSLQGHVRLPVWTLVLSSTQVEYLFDTFMTNRADGLVTLQTFNMNKGGVWECYTATMQYVYGSATSVNNNWLPTTTLRFEEATLIT